MTNPIVAVLLAGIFALPATPQEAGPSREAQALGSDELVLRYYRPREVDEDYLLETVSQLFGHQILVRPSPGTRGQTAETQWVPHFLELEGTILVRDLREQADRILATMREIEDAIHPPQTEEARPRRRRELETLEYTPRYLSPRAVRQALEPYWRMMTVPPPTSGSYTEVENISFSSELRRVFVRETPERIAEIQHFLGRVDVPAPQATFTFLVIVGRAADANGTAPPAELAEHLRRLLPVESFSVLASGVLRGSVHDAMEVRAEARGVSYVLELQPAAFDADEQVLSLQQCSFQVESGTESQKPFEQGFRTSLSLRAGEDTVLGALGEDPVFVVLRMRMES